MAHVQPIHVLLVEDNPADAHLITKAFEEQCHDVSLFIAEDGVVATDYLFRRGKFKDAPIPRLILLDLNLPGKDGREVLEEIKAERHLKTIPVVMFTSSEADNDVRSCYEAGANAYFAKPTDLDDFMGVINTICLHGLKKAKLPRP